MLISAHLHNRPGAQDVRLTTRGVQHPLDVPPRASGRGSSASGGELLCLALATCYANDLFREAPEFGVVVDEVAVDVDGTWGGAGEPAAGFTYRVWIRAQGAPEQIRALADHTDRVAEVHHTLRRGVPVLLEDVAVVAVAAAAG